MGKTKCVNEILPKDQRLGQVGYNNNSERIAIIKYNSSEDIDVEFDDGIKVMNRTYNDFCRGKIKHPIRYEESIAYHIEVELKKNLDDIWNWEKNNELGIDPHTTSKYSNKKVFLFCDNYDNHNYDKNGNRIGYEISIYHFTEGQRCGYCSTHKTHFKDSIGYLYPDIAKMISIPENDIDTYSISPYSHKKVHVKCPNCGKISKNKKTIQTITINKIGCEFCSDSISLPNKMLRQIAKQLNLNWVFEYSELWMNGCRFDAYDVDLKQPIEMDAPCRDNHKGERKEIDDWKDEEAINHGMKKTIRINLMDNKQYNENLFEYIKEQIIEALGHIYNFDNFDWELAWKNIQKSLAIEALKLYKEGYSIKKIAEKLNVCYQTVSKWLKNFGVKNQYELVEERKEKALKLYKEVYNVKKIAEELNVSCQTVRKYLREFKKEGLI